MVVPEISVDELAERLEAGSFLLDVRQPDEYEAGHVPGARSSCPSATCPSGWASCRRAGSWSYCRSGARSLAAAEFLVEQHGIDAVNVAGGTLAWMASGRDAVPVAGPHDGADEDLPQPRAVPRRSSGSPIPPPSTP